MYTLEKKNKSLPEEARPQKPSEKRYDYGDVLKACIAYFKGDELAATTWMNKYAMKDGEGKFYERTPEDMHRRMAVEFARIEKRYEQKLPAKKQKELSRYGQ